MTNKTMSFLADFDKSLNKIAESGSISLSSEPPRYWYSTGNYVLNRIMSGSFKRGIPQGRITDLAGPSGAGKSFLAANLVAAAQREGAYCLVLDSENALDDEFMQAIGVDTDSNYRHIGVTTIPDVTKIVSTFLKGYRADGGDHPDAMQVLIVVDSLDMLMTATEVEHFEKGDQKGDQGQKNKQLKAMLKTFVQAIKDLNVAMICTSQVYRNQDPMNGEGAWIVSDAVKYACSQILLVQKRKLKDDSAGAKVTDVAGVRIVCEGYKTRFTKPFQRVEVEVPYSTGMDPHSGLKEAAVAAGVLEKRGSRLSVVGDDATWFERDIGQYAERLIDMMEKADTALVIADEAIAAEGDSKKDLVRRQHEKLQSEGLSQES